MSSELDQNYVLRDTIKSTEETLRAYDLKAEIAMICFVLSVEAINVFLELGKLRSSHTVLVAAMFLLFIGAMVGYMSVLLPVYKSKPADPTSYSSANLFFVTNTKSLTVDQYLRKLEHANLREEMVHQIMMLSEIRDSKNQRFLVALFLSMAFYAMTLAASWFVMQRV